jgi:hypothetical protein
MAGENGSGERGCGTANVKSSDDKPEESDDVRGVKGGVVGFKDVEKEEEEE